MTPFVKQARQAIAAEGGRMTNQRQIILDVIDRSREHLTADDITARAQQLDRSINPSTVYRTLALLTEHGLIKSRYYDQDSHREVFEPTPNTEHYHFTCSRCGRVRSCTSMRWQASRSCRGGAAVQACCWLLRWC